MTRPALPATGAPTARRPHPAPPAARPPVAAPRPAHTALRTRRAPAARPASPDRPVIPVIPVTAVVPENAQEGGPVIPAPENGDAR
jgi:hypothetical protein